MTDKNNLVKNKREYLQKLIKYRGTDAKLSFVYVGKPKTFTSIDGKLVRLNGLEKLDRVKGKIKSKGKILLRERYSQELIRVSIRDLEISYSKKR